MNQPTPKTYVPKCSARLVEFSDGGSLLKLSCDAHALAEFAREHKRESGYRMLCIAKRREVGKFGETHSVYLDTFKPDPGKRMQEPQRAPEPSGNDQKVDEEDIPF